MAHLKLDNVHKSFGDTKVIHGVDLDVEDGEFTVFVGPSGCGKSTLLRMIAGLEAVTSGSLSIDHVDVTNADPSDRDIHRLQQPDRAKHILFVIGQRVCLGLSNSLQPGEMDHNVRPESGNALG